MKENIEEDLITLEQYLNAIDTFGTIDYKCINNLYEPVKSILSDYKRVLKENEELLREKIDNKKIIALARNEFLGYEQGYQDGKAGRGSATQTIIEGQQYYIIQEQIERYKNQIEKLQKEIEELKDYRRRFVDATDNELKEANNYFMYKYTFRGDELAQHINTLLKAVNNSIPTQKIKDEIEYINKFEEDLYKKENIIQVLQDLLESEEK